MVQVQIALYDLLPPGKLSTTFYYLGVGIYHSSIRIPELQVEFAYGGILPGSHTGRDVSNLTGIFVLPSPEDHRVTERLLAGPRFVRRIDVGEWGNAFEGNNASARPYSIHKPLPPLPDSTARNNRRRPRYKNHLSSSSSSGNLPLLPHGDSSGHTDEWGRKMSSPPGFDSTDRFSTFSDPLMTSPISHDGPSQLPFHESVASGDTDMDNDQSQPASHATLSSHFEFDGHNGSSIGSDLSSLLSLIEDMKTEPEWRATRYHLLAKNCNSFTDELCYRLTGRHAPSYVNRAAWLAQSLPCLVPDGWLEPPTAQELQEIGIFEQASAEGQRPTSPLIAVPYVDTSPMRINLQYEAVQAKF